MTTLSPPDLRLYATWAEAMADHHPEGQHVNGAGLWMLPEAEQWDLTEAGCRRLVDVLLAAADEPEDDDKVPCEFFWVTDGEPEQVVGLPRAAHPPQRLAVQRGRAHRLLGPAVPPP